MPQSIIKWAARNLLIKRIKTLLGGHFVLIEMIEMKIPWQVGIKKQFIASWWTLVVTLHYLSGYGNCQYFFKSIGHS